jgi:hypothetical protein
MIGGRLADGRLCCGKCFKRYRLNTSYERHVKETGETLRIQVVYCKSCKEYHALLPDFISPYKQYSAAEIEKVVTDRSRVSDIPTQASESTVRRWKVQIGERTMRANSTLKARLIEMLVKAVSEIYLEGKTIYEELAHLLSRFPERPERSGTAIGEANIWLGSWNKRAYI